MNDIMECKCIFLNLVLIVIAHLQHVSSEKLNEKRILLNDPEVLSHQIGTLTQRLATVESLVQTLQTDNKNQQTENLNQRIEIDNLKKTVQTLHSSNVVMYVRWGRKGCATNGTELIYSGFAAGNRYRTGGGVATTVCMPNNPTWGKQTVPNPDYHVEMEGSEYDTDFFGPNTADEDTPCALCRHPAKSSVIMIPGRTSCYPGLSMEYTGYLAGGDYHSPSDYICIDKNPEVVMGGFANDDSGRGFFPTKVFCGPLPCPPYQEEKIVACVVCSK